MARSTVSPPVREGTRLYRTIFDRALAGRAPAELHLHYHAGVLDKYRGPGSSVVRTDSVGRVRKDGGWSLNFGISPDETLIHVPIADLLDLPAAELEHWSAFLETLPMSANFLRMRLRPGSCVDDGDTRPWLPGAP